MDIAVCVKHVATLGDEVEWDDSHTDVDPDYLEWSLNEWDAYAVEEALRMREAAGEGEVFLLTVGDGEADESLRRGLAMGADRAVRIDPGDGAGVLDPLTVARALAGVLRERPAGLVLAGVQSSDAVQAATGTMLGQLLDLPTVAVVKKVELRSGAARVQRELEGGLIDVMDVDLPALLTVQTGINEPRYANLRAIKQAKEKEIAVRDLVVDGEGCLRVTSMFAPPAGETAESLGDSPADVARRIIEIVGAKLS
ncbi:MAG: electron transfer flavoprotein subunit beta/FixA family protein [Acidimicrobiales bacterium]